MQKNEKNIWLKVDFMISYYPREEFMNKTNIRFLSSVLVMSVFGITGGYAAPSVKMLGTNTARIGTNAAVVRTDNANTTSTQRLGAVRAKGVVSGTPVTVNKVSSKVNTSDSGSDARLSLGKYIHTTGVASGTIKPVSTSGIDTASSEFIALADRVTTLEEDKISMDPKFFGEGLVVDTEKNKISIDPTILQAQVESTVENTLKEDYYTADQIDDILDESGITPPTYASATQEEVEYETITVADKFDEDFDFTK